ncbi:hypothetical protein C8N35_101245 [Breoghania corrubedonensis]|uniref:Uncharacterized protein n=1 Tax=Breoghania corrubedonensis TaxID=665038 RepID=A0A2T5VEN8_9HYPH|nr:hypothetical protein [Breoghania corrubedonensis]PTW62208.1 hypothetical protein C8N35_101245 [Breoghania corrubedonensis]
MLGKFGVLIVALGVVFLIARVLSEQGRRVERTLSKSARRSQNNAAKTLVRDPETGKYRARDDREA